jgi:16S rRNA (guanine(966)-N(2))-methyltransferase RsmD
MRIISGSSKGRRLATRKSDAIRPTSDRVKESLFGILGDRVKERRVLDLFAGTGNLGIEALSRGARRAVFVEMGRQAVPVIRRNLAECGMWDRSEIVPKDVIRAIGVLKERSERFDLILVDPPYGKGMVQRTLLKLSSNPIYHDDSILVIQHDRREPLSSSAGNWNLIRQKRIGDTLLSFLVPVSEPAEVRPEASPPGDLTPEEDDEPKE